MSQDIKSTLFRSFATIIFSEIGDKTFLIAAILAMRHPRIVVFAGAFGSLLLMSVLSAVMGHVLPSLLPKQWTQLAAGILFLCFGCKMLLEVRGMQSGSAKIQEEMREAEEEIENDDADTPGGQSFPLQRLEEGEASPSEHIHEGARRSASKDKGLVDGARNLCNFIFGPVFVQAFMLTFLGEWGDRSQIATMVLGATHVRPSVSFVGRTDHLTPAGRCVCARPRAERVSRDAGDGRGTQRVYRPRRARGSVHLEQDIGQAWYVCRLALVHGRGR